MKSLAGRSLRGLARQATRPVIFVAGGCFGGLVVFLLSSCRPPAVISQSAHAPAVAAWEAVAAKQESAAALSDKPTAAVLSSDKPTAAANDEMHIIFTTDCELRNNWQAKVLLNSAREVGETAPITQIVCGCKQEPAYRAQVRQELNHMYPNARAHFAPDPYDDPDDFGFYDKILIQKDTPDRYRVLNRPLGIRHWLEQAQVDEDVVAILDPDFVFLRPLSTSIGPKREVQDLPRLQTEYDLEPAFHELAERFHVPPEEYRAKRPPLGPDSDTVARGKMVGQYYGIGRLVYLSAHSGICQHGPDSGDPEACDQLSFKDAWGKYSLGPPWFIHREDLRMMVPTWFLFTVKEYQRTYDHKRKMGDLLAEQLSYSTAALYHKISATRLDHYMVSRGDISGEGWPLIQRLLSNNGMFESKSKSSTTLSHKGACHLQDFLVRSDAPPVFLHYCQIYYMRDRWYWNKKDPVLGTLLECDKPLLAEPPADFLGGLDWKTQPQHGIPATNSWLFCNLVPRINNAALRYREYKCGGSGVNTDRAVRMEPEEYRLKTQPKHFQEMWGWGMPADEAGASSSSTQGAPKTFQAQLKKLIGPKMVSKGYHTLLIQNGFDDLEALAQLSKEELVQIGVKRGHVKRLLYALRPK